MTESNREALEASTLWLQSQNVALVVGTVVDLCGVIRGKGIPLRRLGAFCDSGMGAAPSWSVFCIDNALAFTPSIGVVGDLRLRLDLDGISLIDERLAWGPANIHEQDGSPSELCPRRRLASIVEKAAERGLSPLMGTELEFTLTTLDGKRIPKRSWAAYGMPAVAAYSGFLVDLAATMEKAGVSPEQIHPEAGEDQFEVSLAPASPVEMADAGVLARILIGIVAARHGMGVSFSPMPWAGGAGNGAHLHLSLMREGQPLFSSGDGPHGITAKGGAAIGGILAGLNDFMAIYGGSVVSGLRLRPGSWSGASACWGLENREAALRFVANTAGNPHGANVELKVVDPSANIYLAAAALLGSAVSGIDANLPLPAEVTINPAESPDKDSMALQTDQSTILGALEESKLAIETLGSAIVQGVVAVRRHEVEQFKNITPAVIADDVRFAWSI
jgi:glutamine synthetase